MDIQKLPQVNESVASAFTQFQNVQPLVYDNALSPYETISKLLWWVKSLTATTNQIIDELDKHEQEYAALKEQVNGINNRLTTAEQELNEAKERLDGHDDDIAEINADLQEIHQTITSIQSDITTLQGRCTEIENRLDGHDTEIQNLKDKDTDLQKQITSNDEDITKLQEKDTDLESQIHSNDTDISNLQQKDTELQAQITTNKNSIDTINTQIIEINGNIDTINSNIDNLQAQITSNDSDITALQGETKQLRTDLTNLSQHVDEVESELQRQITDNDTDIADLQSRMKVVETDVATLKTNVSNLQLEQRLMGDNITVIQNTINTINNNIESINDNIDTINNTLTTIQSNVEQNRQDIVDLTGKVNTNTTDITNLKQQVAALDVDTIKQEITDIQNDISELQSEQADLLKQIKSNDTDIDNLKKADTALQNNITTINQRIETVENSIETLETQGNQNTTDISQLKTDVNDLKSTISTVENQLELSATLDFNVYDYENNLHYWNVVEFDITNMKGNQALLCHGVSTGGERIDFNLEFNNLHSSGAPDDVAFSGKVTYSTAPELNKIGYVKDGAKIKIITCYPRTRDIRFYCIPVVGTGITDPSSLSTHNVTKNRTDLGANVPVGYVQFEVEYIKNVLMDSVEIGTTQYIKLAPYSEEDRANRLVWYQNANTTALMKFYNYGGRKQATELVLTDVPVNQFNTNEIELYLDTDNAWFIKALRGGCFTIFGQYELVTEIPSTTSKNLPVTNTIQNVNTNSTELNSLESRVESAENTLNDVVSSQLGYQHCFLNIFNKIASTTAQSQANQVFIFKGMWSKLSAMSGNLAFFNIKLPIYKAITGTSIADYEFQLAGEIDINTRRGLTHTLGVITFYADNSEYSALKEIIDTGNFKFAVTQSGSDVMLSIGMETIPASLGNMQYAAWLENSNGCQVTETEYFNSDRPVVSHNFKAQYLTLR